MSNDLSNDIIESVYEIFPDQGLIDILKYNILYINVSTIRKSIKNIKRN